MSFRKSSHSWWGVDETLWTTSVRKRKFSKTKDFFCRFSSVTRNSLPQRDDFFWAPEMLQKITLLNLFVNFKSLLFNEEFPGSRENFVLKFRQNFRLPTKSFHVSNKVFPNFNKSNSSLRSTRKLSLHASNSRNCLFHPHKQHKTLSEHLPKNQIKMMKWKRKRTKVAKLSFLFKNKRSTTLLDERGSGTM